MTELTGILLVGGASHRFGSAKALAELDGETLAERAWRTLGEICTYRLAVGKHADGLALPFPLVDDGRAERAAAYGLEAGLRAAPTDICVVLPVDCPGMTAGALLQLAKACVGYDAAVPRSGPLPGAYRTSALRAIDSADLSLWRLLKRLDVATVDLSASFLTNVNTRSDLSRFRQQAHTITA